MRRDVMGFYPSNSGILDHFHNNLNHILALKGERTASRAEMLDVCYLPPAEAAQALINDRKFIQ